MEFRCAISPCGFPRIGGKTQGAINRDEHVRLITIVPYQVNHLLDKGQYWRLWTPCLLHVNFIHLVVRLLSLPCLCLIVVK